MTEIELGDFYGFFDKIFMFRCYFTIFFSTCWILCIEGCSSQPINQVPDANPISENLPSLKGKLIYHTYSCYDCNDSRLYYYDFLSKKLQCISSNWTIINPMNAQFSPDGSKIVFMGISPLNNSWDVFLCDCNNLQTPIDITLNFGSARDEDPKFSNDGNKIIFKQNGKLKEMDTLGNILRSFDFMDTEASMPFYCKGDSVVVFSKSELNHSTGDLYIINLNTKELKALYSQSGIEEYYPVTIDDTSFYYTSWLSNSNQNDQLYIGYTNGKSSKMIDFGDSYNNYSDVCPVSDKYLILSSTRPGGKGGYDLYLADVGNNRLLNMNLFHPMINSAFEELGASCWIQQ